jgi:hypothetical protein
VILFHFAACLIFYLSLDIISSLLQDILDSLSTNNLLDLLQNIVAISSAHYLALRETGMKTYKSVNGTWGMCSLLQYAMRSESPLAMTLVNKTSA